MSAQNQRRRDRREIKAAAMKVDRAIRIHSRQAFLDLGTAWFPGQSPIRQDVRFIVISHGGRSQESPFAAVDINLVYHQAFAADPIALAHGKFRRRL